MSDHTPASYNRPPASPNMNPPPTPSDPAVLRLLDANANRAREALRVIEDYARFVRSDAELSARLKTIRHELSLATRPWDARAILTRDTPRDVGVTIKTADELARSDIAAVVIAAGKRMGESLRAIEEFAKIIAPDTAAVVERLRYSFYDIEQQLHRALHPAAQFAAVRLYVLITQSACRRPWLEVAEQAIAGGADCLQLREKDLDGAQLLNRATALVALCRRAGVLCIINDRPDIAILAGADGVHLGQSDLPATAARRMLGPGKVIGISTHTLAKAQQAERDGADYVGVGPVFPSPTKPRDFLPGLAFARQAAAHLQIPTVAIAGIIPSNLPEVLATGVRAIAVTAAVSGCDDVRAATAQLKQTLTASKTDGVVQTDLPAEDSAAVQTDLRSCSTSAAATENSTSC
jgi:thiamine-phosphate pyrophosphorylase